MIQKKCQIILTLLLVIAMVVVAGCSSQAEQRQGAGPVDRGYDPDGSYGFDQHRPGWGVPIHQLLVENHVTAFFHGHDHFFGRQELDGVTYQEVPQPANMSSSKLRPGAEYGYVSGDMLASPGHLRVTVSPGSAQVEYIRSGLPSDNTSGSTNRVVAYSYTLPPGRTT